MLMMWALFLPPVKAALKEKTGFNLWVIYKTVGFLFLLILLWIFWGWTSVETGNNSEKQVTINTQVSEKSVENEIWVPKETVAQKEVGEEKKDIVEFIIAEKQDLSRKALGDKSFSEYTALELQEAPIDKKFLFKVVLPGVNTEKQVKDTAEAIINDTIKEDKDMDELSIMLYSEEGLVSWGYDIWSAIWAVNWKLWDISPEQAKNNIRTNHSITFEIKDNLEEYLKNRLVTEDKYWLSEEKRKEIFRAIVAAEDKGREEAEKIFPTDFKHPNYSEDNFMPNLEKNRELNEKYLNEVYAKYGIESDIWDKIVAEWLTDNWPFK